MKIFEFFFLLSSVDHSLQLLLSTTTNNQQQINICHLLVRVYNYRIASLFHLRAPDPVETGFAVCVRDGIIWLYNKILHGIQMANFKWRKINMEQKRDAPIVGNNDVCTAYGKTASVVGLHWSPRLLARGKRKMINKHGVSHGGLINFWVCRTDRTGTAHCPTQQTTIKARRYRDTSSPAAVYAGTDGTP